MKRKLFLIPTAVVVILSLALASCGSDDDDDTAAPTTQAPAPQATTTTAAPAETSPAEPRVELTMRIGSILPETGTLAFLNPPLLNSYRLGVKEVNEAQAGITLESFEEDSGTDPSVANLAADSLIASRVDAVIGAAASGITLAIIDKLVGQKIAMMSGSATSLSLTDYDDDGYFFRTAPSDFLQGQLIAELIIDDAYTRTAIFHRQDDYGVQLAGQIRRSLESSGAEAAVIPYDAEASSFEAEAQQALAAGVDSVVVVAFEEGVKVLQALLNAGVEPTSIYVTDGLSTNRLGELVSPSNPGVVEGITATGLSSNPSVEGLESTFTSRLLEFAPDTGDLIFSAHTYDGVIILALAALQAGTVDAEIFREEVNGITKGGTKCNLFAECAELIAMGEDIDYDGASGRLEFIDVGEPSSGIYEIFVLDSEGDREKVREQELS